MGSLLNLFDPPGNHPSKPKWWAVEIRFSRPLTRREERVLREQYPWEQIGSDGLVAWPWGEKRPGRSDAERLQDTIGRVGVPARVRAVPYGSRCRCEPACNRATLPACAPDFTDEDWREYDPLDAGSREAR